VEHVHRRGTLGTEAAPTVDDIVEKFKNNAARVLTQEKINRAVDAFLNLEKLDNVSQLIKELTP
jgi:hypothetical protein